MLPQELIHLDMPHVRKIPKKPRAFSAKDSFILQSTTTRYNEEEALLYKRVDQLPLHKIIVDFPNP